MSEHKIHMMMRKLNRKEDFDKVNKDESSYKKTFKKTKKKEASSEVELF